MADKIDTILDMVRSQNMASGSSSSSNSSSSYHMVPGLLSSGFIGRETELNWLETTLDPENEKLLGRLAGIHGLTGVGKTQLAYSPMQPC